VLLINSGALQAVHRYAYGIVSYRFRLHRNDLTAEGAENAEGENTEMNNSDATGFDITLNRTLFSVE